MCFVEEEDVMNIIINKYKQIKIIENSDKNIYNNNNINIKVPVYSIINKTKTRQ